MDDARVDDELRRMKLHEDLERAREILAGYHEGEAHYRRAIEECQFELGQIDQRLRGGS
jgi:hypothetical protein